MSPVTRKSPRVEWSLRLAHALIEGELGARANLAALVAEAKATGHTPGPAVDQRNWRLPGVIVDALGHLAQLPTVDLAAIVPIRRRQSGCTRGVGREFGSVTFHLKAIAGCGIRRASVGRGSRCTAYRMRASGESGTGRSGRHRPRARSRRGTPCADSGLIPGRASSSPLVDRGPPGRSRRIGSPRCRTACCQRGIPLDPTRRKMPLHIDDLLRYAVTVGASDLHLTTQMPGLSASMAPSGRSRGAGTRQRDDQGHGLRDPAGVPARAIRGGEELDTSHSIAGVVGSG